MEEFLDDFEEFPVQDWDDTENVKVDFEQWETNWDDEIIEDDFAVQLQREVTKLQQQQQPPQAAQPVQ